MKMYKLPPQAMHSYVMSNASDLEGLVIMKREGTKQKTYLYKQTRIIEVPGIIQKGFWACSACEWPLTALEAFRNGLGFWKIYLYDHWLRETADSVIPELFLQCEHSLWK